MFSFIKNIFSTNNKNSTYLKEDKYRIYFDREKIHFMEIKISSDMTCQDLHTLHHNDLLTSLMNLNMTNDNKQILNSADFFLIIIDDDNPLTEIKLKLKDFPLKYMTKRSINLFYLNINDKSRKDKFHDSSRRNSNDICNHYSNSVNNDECIREGELYKYSFKNKKFKKRNVTLDKHKLIIEKQEKDTTNNKGNTF